MDRGIGNRDLCGYLWARLSGGNESRTPAAGLAFAPAGPGLRIHVRHRWLGCGRRGLALAAPSGETTKAAGATILALGGGSWPQLGSDGAWQALVGGTWRHHLPLQPANCGFDIAWSEGFPCEIRYALLKNIGARCGQMHRLGEAMITEHGMEGGLIYALSADLRKKLPSRRLSFS